MAITPFNLTQGSATLYFGQFGTTEPADSAVTSAPGGGWTDVGGTVDGQPVTFEVDLTYTAQGVDQVPEDVGARLTKRVATVTAQLAETTLANMQMAMNYTATTAASGSVATLDPLSSTSATQPTYTALIIDGWAPTLTTGALARRRLIIRKTLSQAKISLAYEKSKMAVYNVTWSSYYISGSINAWHIVEQTA